MEPISFLTDTRRPLAPRGFTLVEMLVVLSIIVLITTVTITGQSAFNRSSLLTDTAYTIAITIRQAQTYGLSSKAFGGIQNAGYGIHVDTTNLRVYSLYADLLATQSGPSNCPLAALAGTPEAKPGNCLYDSASEQVQRYLLDRGFAFTKFCGKNSNNRYCSNGSPQTDGVAITAMDIEFLRPNTESIITAVRGGALFPLTSAELYLSPNDGTTVVRVLCVSQVGQVSVSTTTCP